MAQDVVEKLPQVAAEAKPQFRNTRSAAEMAMLDSEGYADEGFSLHKKSPGRHLDGHWHKGHGGLRSEGEDLSDEEQRLHELESRGERPGVVQRAKDAMTRAGAAVAETVGFKASRSAAELAYGDAEGYASEGYAEHKAAGDKHLEEHWRKGYGGLRKEGEDYQDEQERLQDLHKQGRAGPSMVESMKEAVTSTAAAASDKASELLQAAKEAVGLEKK
ncbi:hypothetical protein N2152v2_011185 [Parachlorella kessleri]